MSKHNSLQRTALQFTSAHRSNNRFMLPDIPMEEPEPDIPRLGEYARKLQDFADKVCAEPLQNPAHIKLAQTRLLVLDRFLELYSAAPKRTRNELLRVFLTIMTTLRECELARLSPPQLYIPSPAPAAPAPTPQIMGIFLGEEE